MSEVATVKSTPQSTPKRTPARSTKKDPWSEEQLTTSSKSRLIDADLVVRVCLEAHTDSMS